MKKTKQQQQLSNSRKKTRRHCPDFESSTSRKRRWDILGIWSAKAERMWSYNMKPHHFSICRIGFWTTEFSS